MPDPYDDIQYPRSGARGVFRRIGKERREERGWWYWIGLFGVCVYAGAKLRRFL